MTNLSKSVCVSSFLISACLTLCFNSGCKPSQKKIEEKQAKLEQMAESTFNDIATLESEQKFAEAEELISAALKNDSFAAYRNRLLARKSELLTRQDKTSEAEDLLVSYLKSEPEVTQEALNDLFQFYNNNKQFDKSITLSGRIISSGGQHT